MLKADLLKNAKYLQQIADMLLLNGTLTESPGLVRGKIGIAIFFFHYAQYTDNGLYADYAMDLIDEILNQIHINSPADYEKGVAGIGVGFDYLIRNNYLNVDDDICEDFDHLMARALTSDARPDFSLYNGLTGYGRYWITRLRYQKTTKLALKCLLRIVELIDEGLPYISKVEQSDVFCFLVDLHKTVDFDSCNKLLKQYQSIMQVESLDVIQNFSRLGDSVIGNAIRVNLFNRYFKSPLFEDVDFELNQIPDLDIEKAPLSTGLLNGYAGEGMLRLMALDKSNSSWVYLL